MAQYKGILIFLEGSHGWTESYYMLASTPAGAATNLIAVANARLDILHSDLFIASASISDVAIRGDTTPVVSILEPGTFVDASGYMDLDVAVLVKWMVGVFNRNKTFLRGIPLGATKDGLYLPDPTYVAAMSDYLAAVTANCVLPVTTRNVAPPPNYLVSSYQPILDASIVQRLARRKAGRPIGLPRGRRVAP